MRRRAGRERSREEEEGERGSEEDGKEGGREVVRKEGERYGGGGWRGRRGEAVRRRIERKGEKGSEENDYFNKFPPTMPSVVLENRSIRIFKVSYRSAPK